MPRLILKGDVTSNIGEYLPAPFIDRVYIEGDGSSSQFKIRTSVFIPDEINRIVSQDGEPTQDEEAYRTSLEKVKYYTMALINLEETEFYEMIISGDLNPLVLYKLISDSPWSDKIILEQFKPMAATSQILFDEDGNKILNYTSEKTYVAYREVANQNGPPSKTPIAWRNINLMQILSFSSTIEPDDIDIDNINLLLLNAETSDISHEVVFEKGKFANRNQTEYVDNDDVIYNNIPLIAVDSSVYKVDKITHEQIVEKFRDLLDEFSTSYEKDKGFNKLKRMMDRVSLVIETYGDKADLLLQLNTIRKVFPDKAPIKPVGKFYKRFGKRLSSINKIVKDGQILRRKIVYNRKSIDLRPGSISTTHAHSFDNRSDDSRYIYTDWANYDYDVQKQQNGVGLHAVLGYFFFDYEKDLRRRSNISKLFDVNKLENWNIYIPYENFEVDYASVRRASVAQGKPTGGGTGGGVGLAGSYGHDAMMDPHENGARGSYRGENVEIRSIMREDTGFPITEQISVTDNGRLDTSEIVPDLGTYQIYLEETPYGSTKTSAAGWAEAGYISSLVLRSFINPTNKSFSGIENYRLMCYELLDYREDASSTSYLAKVLITDDTVSTANYLTSSCRSALSDMEDYYALVNKLCAFDDDAAVFNDFFSDAMLSEYEGNITKAPWYSGPIIYSMHLDLVYNTYAGDLQQIIEAAEKISDQINPVDGTKKAIAMFLETFSEFINNIYGPTPGSDAGVIGSQIVNMIKEEKVFEVTLPLGGAIGAGGGPRSQRHTGTGTGGTDIEGSLV